MRLDFCDTRFCILVMACCFASLLGCRDSATTSREGGSSSSAQADVVADVQALTDGGAKFKEDDSGSVIEVDFRGSTIDNEGLRHLSGLSKVRSLRLNDTAIDDAGLQHVGEVHSLQSLDLRGCKVSNDGLAWLKSLENLKALRLTGKDGKATVDDAGLESLACLSKLKAISLDYLWISGDGLAHLKNSKEIVELNLAGTLVDDVAVENLKQFPKLKKLRLSASQLTSEGLKVLGSLSSLEQLDLSENSQIFDDGIAHLKPLAELKRLNLWRVGVTDEGVSHLAGMTKMEWLNLDNSKLSDAGLTHLREMTKLNFLHLGSTSVSDDGLVHLHPLTSLADLKVTRTAVTAAGAEALQAKLPDTKIQLKYIAGE